MNLEINARFVQTDAALQVGDHVLLITPPLNEAYWLARVPVSEKQAVVCFPKFGTIGIGFQVEDDWNTNLPYTCDAQDIYEHIEHNKDAAPDVEDIPPERCIEAIQVLQHYVSSAVGPPA